MQKNNGSIVSTFVALAAIELHQAARQASSLLGLISRRPLVAPLINLSITQS